MHEEKKEIFGCEKKKRREILREEDKGDVVKCCYVFEVKHFCCVFTNIKTCTSSLYL
jgi:hypothetical protein